MLQAPAGNSFLPAFQQSEEAVGAPARLALLDVYCHAPIANLGCVLALLNNLQLLL